MTNVPTPLTDAALHLPYSQQWNALLTRSRELERHAEALAVAISVLRGYRKRSIGNFQLEKADDFMRICFIAQDDYEAWKEKQHG